MFYIEKNDKPNVLEKLFCTLRVENNTIYVPLSEDFDFKKIDKLAKRTKKIVFKNSNSKKIVISKEFQDDNANDKIYINCLNTYELEISDGMFLYELLIPDVISYLCNKKDIWKLENIKNKKISLSILINDLTDVEIQNIYTLVHKYKSINIVTNHTEKFKRLTEKLEDEGIILDITNNKKRSLLKQDIILNIDFPEELLNQYNIRDECILVNIKNKAKISKKRFSGITINDYEINFRDDIKTEKAFTKKYYLKDLYESEIYRKQRIQEILKKIRNDNVVISKLILSNGEL